MTAAGARTRLYRAELDARQRQEPRSEMARGLTRLIRVLALLSLPLCLCKYLLYVRRGSDALSAGVSAVSSLMGMLPAALLLLSAAAMLLSTAVLRRRQVLARDLYSVEMFGRIDTLCFDKTGTLTCGTAADVLRGEARETVAYFRAEGVDVRLLTGDTPEAAAAIARAAPRRPARRLCRALRRGARRGDGIRRGVRLRHRRAKGADRGRAARRRALRRHGGRRRERRGRVPHGRLQRGHGARVRGRAQRGAARAAG